MMRKRCRKVAAQEGEVTGDRGRRRARRQVTERWGKKVGQRQRDRGQRFREIDREKVGKERYPDTRGEIRTGIER